MTDKSCHTCSYWSPPIIPKRQSKKVVYLGSCNKISTWMGPDNLVEINAPSGCVECDPYSMDVTELKTAWNFGCSLYKVKDD